MQHEPGPPEHRAEEGRDRRGSLPELGKDERFFLLRGDDLGNLAQAGELAAVSFAPGAVAQTLGRMVANLLEAHEKGQHEAPALNAVALPDARSKFRHCLLVERSLPSAQLAVQIGRASCR